MSCLKPERYLLLLVLVVAANPQIRANGEAAGFRRAAPGYEWSFPRDHGSHDDFRTEWWYYTGHLNDESEGRTYGFHLTFFRFAVDPEVQAEPLDSTFALRQIYWAHFAISDLATGEFYQTERLNRGFPGVAEASDAKLLLRNGRWSAENIDGEHHLEAHLLTEEGDDWAIDLRLQPTKGPVLHGDAGYSQKGPEPGQASMYYSMPRMEVKGTLSIEGRPRGVSGSAWMDHEFMTNLLADDQEGWDWFSIQLDDGTELMLYQIRLQDGGIEPMSKGTFVRRDGTKVPLQREDYRIESTDAWTSPHTGADYPAGWTVGVPKLDLELRVRPNIADQEMRTHRAARTNYWEGSCSAEGSRAGRPVKGRGYTELVGYDKKFDAEI